MRRITVLVLLLAACTSCAAEVKLFPRPKVAVFPASSPVALGAKSTVIVIGSKATEPEQYAAETLQRTVETRFAVKWPIVRESSIPKSCRTVIVLGQRSTSTLVDTLCRNWKVDLSAKSPGHDGYVIHFGTDSGRNVVIAGGSEPRGVIYGQDTLFRLIERTGSGLALHRAAIRDWPSIPWRGRVRTHFSQHNRQDTFDAMAQARVNFIDVRDAPDTFGTPPGRELDKSGISAVIKQAHRRGMIVYGQVNCAAPGAKHDAAIKTFEDFIALGVDGLWMSFPMALSGTESGMTPEFVKRVVELGRKHGMTGSRIAIQPGKESYRTIVTEPNRQIAAVDGMADAMWYFAVKPSKQSLADARAIGIRSKPCWWNHWPRPVMGFDFRDNFTQRLDGKPVYTNIPPLFEGYQTPTWEELADAADNIAGVMPWGGSVWGTEYSTHPISLWGWAPELHKWDENRARIYDIVFGPAAVKDAFEYDDILADAEKRIRCLDPPGAEVFTWPPILNSAADRAEVVKAADALEAPLKRIAEKSPSGTLIAKNLLEEYYLEPMGHTIKAARLIASLNYPEYWWPQHEKRLLMAVGIGNTDQALRWQQEALDKLRNDSAQCVKDASVDLKMGDYADKWVTRIPTWGEGRVVGRPVNMTGDLSDPLWQSAPALPGYGILNDPGATPENPTEVRVLCDDTAVYVGFTCHEPFMDRMVCNHKEKGSEVWEDDSVEVFINTDALLGHYCHLIANSAGVTYGDWDETREPFTGEWEVKTVRGADRWGVEFRIPYASLGVSGPPKGGVWMCNFARNDYAMDPQRGAGAQQITAWGHGRGGGLHDPSKFKPVWFK